MVNIHDGSSGPFPHLNEGCNKGFSESAPEVSTCESDISLCRSVNITVLLLDYRMIYCHFSPKDARNVLVFAIGTLPLCVADHFMETCRMTKCLKMIIFVMMSMGIHAAALIFWIWIGFLHLGILVKMSYVQGISVCLANI